MMNATLVLIIVLAVISFIQIIILIILGAFIVSFRDQMNGMFRDFIDAFAKLEVSQVSKNLQDHKKSWEEKYEEELNYVQRLMRGESNLVDLQLPQVKPQKDV